jgi:transposase
MADYLTKETGQEVSRYSVSRILKKFNITRKKSTNHYLEQSKHIRKISRFKKTTFPRLLHSRVFALDECSFHLNEVPRYGYSHKSYRANSQKPGKQGNNHTLMLCVESVTSKGVIHYELMEGGMKTENFHNFLSQINLLGKGKKYLIMDNLKVHHAKQSCIKLKLTPIKELLRSKSIRPIYLPPYTPELNPTELCFNFIRQQVEKNKPRTYEELKLVIDKIMDMLNQQDLTKHFRHCFDYDYQWMPRNKNFNFFVSKKESAVLSSIFEKARA